MSQYKFNMYNTEHHYRDRYCLLHYVQDDVPLYKNLYILTHQLISYCLRPLEESHFIEDFNVNNTIHSNFTFKQLQEKNISSQQLLFWSASFDMAEQYEIFLMNLSNTSSFDSQLIFYNCTSPWFGPYCRFAFDVGNNHSFYDIILSNMISTLEMSQNTISTCYKHLHCTLAFSCLDWRNICDRKMDCLDGLDEIHCWQLEINECAENEYRCHNGLCIPSEFYYDVILNPDCLDRTDEPENEYYSTICFDDPSFRCEEHICRPGENDCSFGGGEPCKSEINLRCNHRLNERLLDEPCSIAMSCLMKIYMPYDERCQKYCTKNNCTKQHCPSLYEFPAGPILYEHVRFLYTNKEMEIIMGRITPPDYVCYNETLCADFLPATVHPNNLDCRPFDQLGLKTILGFYGSFSTLVEYVKNRFRTCLIVSNDIYHCKNTNMYQCLNSSKCISKHRLVDGIQDCPYNDDETYNMSCLLNDYNYRFTCINDNKTRCLAPFMIEDGKFDCDMDDDEVSTKERLIKQHIHFQTICDGKQELTPIMINGQMETDETHCEHWLCNNTYTRCDGFWSCKNGADEINCSPSICPPLEHDCIFFNDTSSISCLPIAQAGDGNIDCLGGSDERTYCRMFEMITRDKSRFRCLNTSQCIPIDNVSNKRNECLSGDDERIYRTHSFLPKGVCFSSLSQYRTDVENFLCNITDVFKRLIIHFILHNVPNYALEISDETITYSLSSSVETTTPLPYIHSTVKIVDTPDRFCNRGLRLHIQMGENLTELHCLCSPSYYGDRCQYQNQRVSLTIQMRATSDWQTIFTFMTLLIDHENNIESYDFIEYLPIRDCNTKFNVYLLYSTRPKHSLKNYSVRINVYNKLTLTYRVSWIFPIEFSFLPVHRLTIRLIIPWSNMEAIHQCIPSCIHGQCFNYVNDQNSLFCLCQPGWSGIRCNINYTNICAPNSLSIINSLCLCPIGYYGSRCYLRQSLCSSEFCSNNVSLCFIIKYIVYIKKQT